MGIAYVGSKSDFKWYMAMVEQVLQSRGYDVRTPITELDNDTFSCLSILGKSYR